VNSLMGNKRDSKRDYRIEAEAKIEDRFSHLDDYTIKHNNHK